MRFGSPNRIKAPSLTSEFSPSTALTSAISHSTSFRASSWCPILSLDRSSTREQRNKRSETRSNGADCSGWLGRQGPQDRLPSYPISTRYSGRSRLPSERLEGTGKPPSSSRSRRRGQRPSWRLCSLAERSISPSSSARRGIPAEYVVRVFQIRDNWNERSGSGKSSRSFSRCEKRDKTRTSSAELSNSSSPHGWNY